MDDYVVPRSGKFDSFVEFFTRELKPGARTFKWGQTLIIDLIRLYFCLISDCLDISDLTMFALRLTAEYVRPNNSPICLFVYKSVPLKNKARHLGPECLF